MSEGVVRESGSTPVSFHREAASADSDDVGVVVVFDSSEVFVCKEDPSIVFLN